MRTRLAIIAILALAVLLTPNRALWAKDEAEGPIDLRFRFTEGQTLKLKTTVDQYVVVQFGGQENATHQIIAIGQTLDVKKVHADGSATIDITFGPITATTEGVMGKLEYDSDNPPDDVPMALKGYAAMVGQTFTMRMTPRGRVKEVTGIDKMYEHLLESIDIPDEAMKEQFLEDMKRQFGNEALKEMMEQITAVLPDEPQAVGDSWSQQTTITKGFPMILETTATLTDRTGGVCTIDLESIVKPLAGAPPMKMGPATIQYKLEGTQSGTVKINDATGWFVEGKLKQKLTGEMTVTGPGGEDEKVSLPLTADGTITFETE